MSNKPDFIPAPKQGALDFVALGALIHRLAGPTSNGVLTN